MSRLEDRLRNAYLGAADTVTPETLRGLDEPVTRRSGLGRVLAPLSAAAAVAAIIVLAAVGLRPALGQHQPGLGAASAAEPRFVITTPTGVSPLQVRNLATGALVAQVTLPDPNLAHGGRTYVTAVATADGHHYLAAVYGNPCRSWLYQFQLNDQGQPSDVTTFGALPTVRSELYGLTFSGNGQMIGYTTTDCMGAKPQPSYVATTNIRSRQTRRWTVPGGGVVESVSLTADGGLLCYSLEENPSVVRVIPTSAAPGSAAGRGRTVVGAAQFGGSEWIAFAAISPDGKAVYFTTYTEPFGGQEAGQVRVEDLATGRSRVVHAPAGGQPGLITVDPAVRHFLLQVQLKGDARKLASLDLATGKVTYLPSAWLGFGGAAISW